MVCVSASLVSTALVCVWPSLEDLHTQIRNRMQTWNLAPHGACVMHVWCLHSQALQSAGLKVFNYL